LSLDRSRVLVRTSIATLPGRYSVAIAYVVNGHFNKVAFFAIFFISTFNIWFIKVLAGFKCCVPGAGSIEVIKHQIHVVLLLSLQVVSNFNVAVNLDLDVRIRLAAQGTGFH